MTSESKIILLLTGASHFSVHASMLIFPGIMTTLQSEFNVGLDTLGWMYMLSSFMFGLGSLPAGWLEQKVGARWLLITFQICASLSGLIVVFAHDWIVMTLGMMLMGLSASIYHPAGLTIISRRIRQTTRGMGYHGIAGSLGLAVGPLLASWFASTLNWRFAYVTMILLWVILAVGTAMYIPTRHSIENVKGTSGPTRTRMRPLFTYYLITALIGLAFSGFTTYMPVFFSQNLRNIFSGFNGVVAGGLATTIVLMAGIPGQYVGGIWGDRYNKTRLLFIICIIHIPLLLAFLAGSGGIALFCGILLGFVHFMYQPVGNAMIAEYTSSESRGIGYGFSFFLSFGVGSLASGIGGSVAVHYGVSTVFLFTAILMLLAALVAFYLKKIA